MRTATVAAVLALAAAGCGGGDDFDTRADEICILPEGGTRVCGQDAQDWCVSTQRMRDEILRAAAAGEPADEFIVDGARQGNRACEQMREAAAELLEAQ